MMSEYIIRKAVSKDIPFLADVVIGAEKGRSDKLSYATLFNLTEKKVKDFIIAIFEEEVNGCELSLNSFFVAENNGHLIAALGGWVEAFKGEMASSILKSNLISYTFGMEAIAYLKTKADIIKGMLFERNPLSLQLEYLYVSNDFVGKGIDAALIKKHEENALAAYPALEKVQSQVFKNSVFAIKLLMKQGYSIINSFKCNHPDVLRYLPCNEKYIMEKILKK